VITANSAEWIIPANTVTAVGNVNYRQAKNNVNVSGSRAIANLTNQTVQVTDSITQITPE
jgi:lipopolysaccharide assembly outer membrane protein LptD (OstA)